MPFYSKTPVGQVEQLLREGRSYVDIGQIVGLSKQRIQQIAKKLGLNSLQEKQRIRAVAYQKKWGDGREKSGFYDACRAKFRQKKSNASVTGYEWTVQFGDITWSTHCPILGLELDYFSETRMENSPSFDRFDSSKGYVTGNVQIVSWRANRIKNNGTADEHRKIAEYLDKTALK